MKQQRRLRKTEEGRISQLMERTPPDIETFRNQALSNGALDPMSLLFRVIEYDKSSWEMLSVPCADIGFREAMETAAGLIESRPDSHFCLEPVGFVQ